MAFFDKIGKKIGDVAGSAADKAKDLAETTKLNSAVSAEEKQMNQYYLEIGKLIFEHDKRNPNSPAAELCTKVLASQQIIAELKQKIVEIKEDKDKKEESEQPASSEAVAVPDSDQPQSEDDRVIAQNICKNCQTENPENSKFCLNCGTSMAEKE